MTWPSHSRVLLALAELYRASQAGQTGRAERPFSVALNKLLQEAGSEEGEAHELALEDLRRVGDRWIRLVPEHRRDPRSIGRVQLPLDAEIAFFSYLGQVAPCQQRANWAALFADASEWPIPQQDGEAWRQFCRTRADRAGHWQLMGPFQLPQIDKGRERLKKLARLLAWDEERAGSSHLVRWVSSLVAGHSKYLEQARGYFEPLLLEATAGRVTGFGDLGIREMPRKVIIHGPLRLTFPEGRTLDVGSLHGATEVDLADLRRAQIECRAERCLTVENKTPFMELVAKRSGVLLVHTSYPGDATLELLRRVPETLEFWHFGDTDPQGFDILRDLRVRSGRPFRPLRMEYRPDDRSPALSPREIELVDRLLEARELIGLDEVVEALRTLRALGRKGNFEQESLPPPPLAGFPFYPEKFR